MAAIRSFRARIGIREPRCRVVRDDQGLRQPARRHFAQLKQNAEWHMELLDEAKQPVSEFAWSRNPWLNLDHPIAPTPPSAAAGEIIPLSVFLRGRS